MKFAKILSILGLSIILSSCGPTSTPTNPSVDPSIEPSTEPSIEPSVDPSGEPSVEPSIDTPVDPSNDESSGITVSQSTFLTPSGKVDGDSNVGYTSYQGGGTATPVVNDGVIRIYQASANAAVGGYITFEVNQGYIVEAKIGTAMNTTINYCIDDEDDFALTTDKELAEGGVYTVSNLQNKSISFYCMGLDKTHRLYVNYIEVTYVLDGSEVPSTDKPTTPTVEGDWTNDEIALMQSHLDGYYLPYYDIAPYTVYWDTDYSCISVIGVSKSSNAIYEYVALLEAEGFTQYASVDEDGFFDYEGYLSDTSLLQIQVYEDESSNFYIDAYLISFDYEWPTTKINDFASAHGITETIPSYPYADVYEVNYSYESLGMLIIYCYTEDANAEQKYITILENAGLTLTYSEEYGTYYGPSPLGSYQVEFFYDAEYGSLDIYIYGDQ